MKMKFEQFTEEVVNKIREFLPERFANASVKLRTVTKNNDSNLTGLEIRCEGNNICPIIYLEQFFNRYQLGEDAVIDFELGVINQEEYNIEIKAVQLFERMLANYIVY